MTFKWEEHKDRIIRLYKLEDKTLSEVRKLMKEECGFEASIRSYRQHLDRWEVAKYNCKKRQARKASAAVLYPASPSCGDTSPGSSADSTEVGQTDVQPIMAPPAEYFANPSNGMPVSHQRRPSFVGSLSPNELPLDSVPPMFMTQTPFSYNASIPSQYLAPINQTGHHYMPSLITGRTPMNMNQHGYSRADVLHGAIRQKDEARVQSMLLQGFPVNARDQESHTPLHNAARFANSDIIGHLLQHGADVNAEGPNLCTPLHMATTAGAVGELLKYNPDLTKQDIDGNTPLHRFLKMPSWWKDPAKKDIVNMIFDHDADLNIANADGETPFHIVVDLFHPHASKGQIQLLSKFLARHPDVNIPMTDGQAPFCVVMGRLLNHLKSRPSDDCFERLDVWTEINNIIRRFLLINANPNEYRPPLLTEFLNPTLYALSLKRLWDTLQILFERVDASLRDANDNTALHHALAKPHPDIEDETIRKRRQKVIKTLLKKTGSDAINVRNADGMTPLQLYVHSWNEDGDFWKTVTTFLRHGADTSSLLQHNFANELRSIIAFPYNINFSNLQRLSTVPLWIGICISACQQTDWAATEDHLKGLKLCSPKPAQANYGEVAFKILLEQLLEKRREQLQQIYAGGKNWRQLYPQQVTEADQLAREYVELMRKPKEKGSSEKVELIYYEFLTELHVLPC